jgi:hypothetical protein
MPDDYDDLDDDDEGGQNPPVPADYRIMRKKARQLDEITPRMEKLERENLVLRTPGLNGLDERKIKALFAAHDGAIDPDGLRATAEALGFVQPAAPVVGQDEQDALERMQDASAGTNQPPAPPDLAAQLANATSEQEVMALVHAHGLGARE